MGKISAHKRSLIQGDTATSSRIGLCIRETSIIPLNYDYSERKNEFAGITIAHCIYFFLSTGHKENSVGKVGIASLYRYRVAMVFM